MDLANQTAARSPALDSFAEIQNWGIASVILIMSVVAVAAAVTRCVVHRSDWPHRLSQTLAGWAFLALSLLHLLLISFGPILFSSSNQ
jgi:hypothetical protein